MKNLFFYLMWVYKKFSLPNFSETQQFLFFIKLIIIKN